MKYILQESSEHPYGWVLTDPETGITITFEEGKFNETQQIQSLDDIPEVFKGLTADQLMAALTAKVRDMAEWLRTDHREILFTSPKRVKEETRRRIGESIKDLRERHGESQRGLAAAIGIGQGHLARIEQGKYGVGIDILAMIADHYSLKLGFWP